MATTKRRHLNYQHIKQKVLNQMTNNPLAKLSVLQLKRAVAIREQMQTLQNELDRLAGGQRASGTNSATPQKKKGKMSAEARAKLSASMTARWAKIKAAKARAERSRK